MTVHLPRSFQMYTGHNYNQMTQSHQQNEVIIHPIHPQLTYHRSHDSSFASQHIHPGPSSQGFILLRHQSTLTCSLVRAYDYPFIRHQSHPCSGQRRNMQAHGLHPLQFIQLGVRSTLSFIVGWYSSICLFSDKVWSAHMIRVDSDVTSSFTGLLIQPSFLKEHNNTSRYKLKRVGVKVFSQVKVSTPNLRNVTLHKSPPISYPQTLGNECAQSTSPSLLSHDLSSIAGLETIHQRIQTASA